MGSTSLLWRVDVQPRGDVLHSGKVDGITSLLWRVDDQSRRDVLHSGKLDGITSLLWRVDAHPRGKVDGIHISSFKSRWPVKSRCPPQ
jgi:hypothetical protein